ncbi:unnamed protein product [Schistocephalus solidus]|uniref:F-box domain-containing protein n=1 Tax=Schistocephalus solidus TaxID=70667 RepID=A0A183SWN9_SCHSO|nr:unnamed protein product [Schistocephalus solidus]
MVSHTSDVADEAAGRVLVRQPTSSNPFCGSYVQNKISSKLASHLLSPSTEPGLKVVPARISPINITGCDTLSNILGWLGLVPCLACACKYWQNCANSRSLWALFETLSSGPRHYNVLAELLLRLIEGLLLELNTFVVFVAFLAFWTLTMLTADEDNLEENYRIKYDPQNSHLRCSRLTYLWPDLRSRLSIHHAASGIFGTSAATEQSTGRTREGNDDDGNFDRKTTSPRETRKDRSLSLRCKIAEACAGFPNVRVQAESMERGEWDCDSPRHRMGNSLKASGAFNGFLLRACAEHCILLIKTFFRLLMWEKATWMHHQSRCCQLLDDALIQR